MNPGSAQPTSAQSEDSGRTRQGPLSAFTQTFDLRSSAILIVLVALALYFQFATDGLFLTPRNVTLLARQASLISVLAAGITIVMVMREIDLATGSAVFVTAIVSAKLLTGETPWNPWAAVAMAILAGLAVGLWNAFWVVVCNVPSFIATLAGLLALRGLGLMWTNAATIGPLPQDFVNFTEGFIEKQTSYLVIFLVAGVAAVFFVRSSRHASKDGESSAYVRLVLHLLVVAGATAVAVWAVYGFMGIPTALIWVAVIALALWWLLRKSRFGRNAYLIGANREAATYAGINVKKHLAIAFLIMGVLYGVGGVMLSSRLGVLTPSTGINLELDVIAAAVIGGVSLRGGVGTVPGAIGGAFLLTVINNGFSLMNVSSFLQDLVKGLILLVALSADSFIRSRRQ